MFHNFYAIKLFLKKKKITNINKRHLKLPDHPYSKKRIFEETFINYINDLLIYINA